MMVILTDAEWITPSFSWESIIYPTSRMQMSKILSMYANKWKWKDIVYRNKSLDNAIGCLGKIRIDIRNKFDRNPLYWNYP